MKGKASGASNTFDCAAEAWQALAGHGLRFGHSAVATQVSDTKTAHVCDCNWRLAVNGPSDLLNRTDTTRFGEPFSAWIAAWIRPSPCARRDAEEVCRGSDDDLQARCSKAGVA